MRACWAVKKRSPQCRVHKIIIHFSKCSQQKEFKCWRENQNVNLQGGESEKTCYLNVKIQRRVAVSFLHVLVPGLSIMLAFVEPIQQFASSQCDLLPAPEALPVLLMLAVPFLPSKYTLKTLINRKILSRTHMLIWNQFDLCINQLVPTRGARIFPDQWYYIKR